MDRVVRIIALITLVASVFLYVSKKVVVPSSVKQFRDVGLTSTDAGLIADCIHAYSHIVLEDGSREEPYIATVADLKLRLRDIGNLAIGLDWKLGERYPELPELLATYFEMDNLDRQKFYDQAHLLIKDLGRV